MLRCEEKDFTPQGLFVWDEFNELEKMKALRLPIYKSAGYAHYNEQLAMGDDLAEMRTRDYRSPAS